MIELGNIAGAEGTPPTADSSGELVKELRYNSDRFVGPTARRSVTELGRMAEDWQVMIPLIWDEQKVIRVAGDDLIASTLTVMPHLFDEGNVNIQPDVESMLPEGRGRTPGQGRAALQCRSLRPPRVSGSDFSILRAQ
jgi:hypothetical protein